MGTRSEIDPDEVARDWSGRGFTCGVWTDPPGQVWQDFVHHCDELVMPLEGDLEFEVNGHVHHLRPGQELLIPAGVVHTVRNVGGTTARWLYGYRR